MRPRIILASGSAGRRELLSKIGLKFEVIPSDIDETLRQDEDVATYVQRLAREKVAVVKDTDAFVIGGDTVVVLDGEMIGKPESRAHAHAMITRLSGRAHQVLSGYCFRWRDQIVVGVDSADVRMRSLSSNEMTGTWMLFPKRLPKQALMPPKMPGST